VESKLLRYFWWIVGPVLLIGIYLWLTPYFKGLSQINPVFLNLGWITIYWYGICLILGILLGLWWLYKKSQSNEFKDHIINLTSLAILSGIIGARLVFVILKWSDFSNNLPTIFNLQGGGISIHGALIFGSIALILYAKLNKLPILKMLDLFVPAVLMGQIVGRFGNFFNQEAFGQPTNLPWKMFVDEAFRPLWLSEFQFFNPTFLYSAIGLGVILILIIQIYKRPVKPGIILLTYLIMYSLLRVFIEFFRVDSDCWGVLTVAQWASLLIVSISLITGLILRHKLKIKS